MRQMSAVLLLTPILECLPRNASVILRMNPRENHGFRSSVDVEVFDEVAGKEEASERDHWERRSMSVAPFKLDCVDAHYHFDRNSKRIEVNNFTFNKAVA